MIRRQCSISFAPYISEASTQYFTTEINCPEKNLARTFLHRGANYSSAFPEGVRLIQVRLHPRPAIPKKKTLKITKLMGCMNFGMIQAMIIIFRQKNGELRRILMLRFSIIFTVM